MTGDCPFCAIAAGPADADLIAYRTARVLVIPALTQRPANPGQVIVLPVAHMITLRQAGPRLRAELSEVVMQVSEASPRAFGAVGTTVFANQHAPDQILDHLHIHVAPRHQGDNFTIPDPFRAPVPHELRAGLAARLRDALRDTPGDSGSCN